MKPLPLRVVHGQRLLQIDFMTIQFLVEVPMSVKAMMATILQNQLTLRGVHSLTQSDCHDIVEQLIEHLRVLELNLAAREIADNPEPH